MLNTARLAAIARRRVNQEEAVAEEGFTLIELLVVLLIIGILLAIAIPTFLSVTSSANNTAAQANLQTALTGAKTFYTEQNQTYSGLCAAAQCPAFGAVDTGISAVVSGTTSSGPHVVSITTSQNGGIVVITARSQGTNDCWGVVDTTTAATVFTQTGFVGTLYFVNKYSGSGAIPGCNASAYLAAGTTTVTGGKTGSSSNGFGSLVG